MTVHLKEADRLRTTKEATPAGRGNGLDGGVMEREESSLPLRHLLLEAFIYPFTRDRRQKHCLRTQRVCHLGRRRGVG